MTGSVMNNFRGARALIVHPDDANRATLATTLRRLGLVVNVVEQGVEANSASDGDYEIVFFDADHGLGELFADAPPPDAAYIAMIGLEAPGRLSRVVRQRCSSYLMKPIRAAGVFTALFIGVNEFSRRRHEMRECQAMAERLAGRRAVIKAIVRIMAKAGVNDEEAYRILRRQSMSRRVPMEVLARQWLSEDVAISLRHTDCLPPLPKPLKNRR